MMSRDETRKVDGDLMRKGFEFCFLTLGIRTPFAFTPELYEEICLRESGHVNGKVLEFHTPTLDNNQSRGKKILGGSSHFNFR